MYITDITDDPVTLVLLGTLVLLVGLPGIVMLTWRVTAPPFRLESFRWLYLGWAFLLGATSVWNLSREVRTSAEQAGADNFVRLAFLALAALIVLFIGAKYRFAFFSELITAVLGIFFVFALWGVASTLWSVSPSGTIYKSLEYCMMIVLFALTASLIKVAFREPREQLLALKSVFDWNWFLIFLLLVSVYVGVLFLPEYAIRRNVGELGFSIQGAIPGIAANGVGQLGAIMGIVALARILLKPRSKIMYIPVLMISLLTMVLAQSRTPMLGFLLAVVAVLIATRRFWLLLTMSGGLLGATLLTGYSETIYEFLRRNQSDENFASLSGRTDYWESSIHALRDNWLGGYGANAGGKYVLQSVLGETGVSSVHSTYVETVLDTGVVGLILLLVGLGAAWFWLFRVRSCLVGDPVGRLLWLESLGVFTVLTVRSVFTITFVWTPAVLIFGLILVFLSVARRQVVQRRNYAGTPFAQPVPAARRRRSGIHG